MNLLEARKQLHDIRSSLNVLGNFVDDCQPVDEDQREHREIARRSLVKLNGAVDNFSQVLNTEIDKKCIIC